MELAGSIAKCLLGKPISPEARMMLSKITPDVSDEEIRDLFRSDERRDSLSDDDELRILTPAEVIQVLQEEYSVDPRLAEASVAALSQQSEFLDPDKCFEWTLDNEPLLSEEDLDELIKEFRERAENEAAENTKLTLDDFTKRMIAASASEAEQLTTKLTKIWNCFLNSVETEEASDFV